MRAGWGMLPRPCNFKCTAPPTQHCPHTTQTQPDTPDLPHTPAGVNKQGCGGGRGGEGGGWAGEKPQGRGGIGGGQTLGGTRLTHFQCWFQW
jgi:hypothetical protein